MRVYPNAEGDGRIEYHCADHNPNPLTPEQLADKDRREDEVGIAALRVEEAMIREMVNSNSPVTSGDRAKTGIPLPRALDRFIWQENEWRALQGKPPIPLRPDWDRVNRASH
jgi:hypothetical protein